jgi:hypothetical protein
VIEGQRLDYNWPCLQQPLVQTGFVGILKH